MKRLYFEVSHSRCGIAAKSARNQKATTSLVSISGASCSFPALSVRTPATRQLDSWDPERSRPCHSYKGYSLCQKPTLEPHRPFLLRFPPPCADLQALCMSLVTGLLKTTALYCPGILRHSTVKDQNLGATCIVSKHIKSERKSQHSFLQGG